MIKSIKILSDKVETNCNFTKVGNYKIEINNLAIEASSYTIKIEFKYAIEAFRDHDYTWGKVDQIRIANWFTPKILKLKNNQLIQANQQIGIWEVNKKAPKVLFWHFNPKNATPIVNYNAKNLRITEQANFSIQPEQPLTLLFPKTSAIEISRSIKSFSAITCFTDHCDFDTLESLREQRLFFKKYNIKVTKGFFLNHYSKRKNTASYQNEHEELQQWRDDGHELSNHSLSQSIKTEDQSFEDFLSFQQPFDDISTWIDHGFQPYNFTSFKKHNKIKGNFGRRLKQKNINNLWNYIDTGTSVNGVINQINHNQFTLKSYYDGIRHESYKTQLALMIKNIVFHYFSNSYSLHLYKQVASYIKTIKLKKSRKKHLKFLVNLVRLSSFLIPVFVLWYFKKNKVYPLAKYTPLIFNHDINEQTFTVFQTLEMIDFKEALNDNNLDLLIKEKGLFIAHTYFSAPLNYHKGKLFGAKNKIDEEVEKRFMYLSKKIKSEDIWNPTLQELVTQLQKLKQVIFDCDENGEVFIVKKDDTIISRQVS